MKWIECKVLTTSEGIEPITALLMDNGVTGTVIDDIDDMKRFLNDNPFNWDYVDEDLLIAESTDVCVTFYLNDGPSGVETLKSITNSLPELSKRLPDIDLGTLSITANDVNDEVWIDNWKKYYKPFPVGNKIIIKPQWEEYNEIGKLVLNINPGHVFGTGQHQTTQMCICEIENHVQKGDCILDLGCGSGILSILGVMLGAKEALAVDFDPNAVDVAYENASLNNVTKKEYTVIPGDILNDDTLRHKLLQKKYRVIIANIVADVVIGALSFVPQCLSDGGVFIASGIISERLPDVCSAVVSSNMSIINTLKIDDWVCITAVKADSDYASDYKGAMHA